MINRATHVLTFLALLVFGLGIFTSITLSAAGHIFLTLAAFLSIYQWRQHSPKEKFPIAVSGSMIALAIFILIIIASVLVNMDTISTPWKNISKAKYFLIALLGIIPLSRFRPSDKEIKVLLLVFISATTVASLAGIIAYYTGMNPLKFKPGCHPHRACGMYGMYMTYGYGISLFQILLTGLLLYRKEIQRYLPTSLLIGAWLVNGLGLFLSMTRGGWLGFLIALPLFFFKKNKKLMLVMGLSFLALFSASYLVVPQVKSFFDFRAGSDDQRISFYKAAIAAFNEKPVLGYGHRNFEPNSAAIKKRHGIDHDFYSGHAHNNYLEALASTGLLGALAFLAFVVLWLKEAYQRDDLLARLTFPFVASFAVTGLFQYTFGDGENLFLIMGIFMVFFSKGAKGTPSISGCPI
jgi:O-antigen ligase